MPLEESIGDWEVIDESGATGSDCEVNKTKSSCEKVGDKSGTKGSIDTGNDDDAELMPVCSFSLVGVNQEDDEWEKAQQQHQQPQGKSAALSNMVGETSNDTQDRSSGQQVGLDNITGLCASQKEQLRTQAEEIRQMKEKLSKNSIYTEECNKIIEAQSKRISCLLATVERLKKKDSDELVQRDEENAELRMEVERLKANPNALRRTPMFEKRALRRRDLVFRCAEQPHDWETPVCKGAQGVTHVDEDVEASAAPSPCRFRRGDLLGA